MIRIISGTLKGRRLQTPEGMDTRPTMDRTREALFGSIQFEVPGARFLDLFAGSGAVGMEAVSRGAVSLDSVECDPKALKVIKENLRTLNIEKCARVWPLRAEKAVDEFAISGKRFDIIFMDPPYHQGYEEKIGQLIAKARILEENGLLVVESASDTDVVIDGMDCVKIRTYKTARFSFFRPKMGECIEL